jgi:hypothetical protein
MNDDNQDYYDRKVQRADVTAWAFFKYSIIAVSLIVGWQLGSWIYLHFIL